MSSKPRYSETQSAIVYFRDFQFPVRVAPPGDEDHAIAAAASIASKEGRGDVASRMVNNKHLCYIEWGTIHQTGVKRPPKSKTEPRPLIEVLPNAPPRVEFTAGKITRYSNPQGLKRHRHRH